MIILSFFVIFGFSQTKNPDEKPIQNQDESIVIDFDGNVYKTVKIGNQIWMAENLKVTHFQDGTIIPQIQDDDKWQKAIQGACCTIEIDSINYEKTYGLLYNYYAIINKHNICPEGWHVPTKEECMELLGYLGGFNKAGKKLKDNSSNLWIIPEGEATNISGFTGLPGGGRGRKGSSGEVGYYATWWSSTSHDDDYAWHWGVYPVKSGIRANAGHKASGFSVRLIKD